MSNVPPAPRFSDARVTFRWAIGVMFPLFVAIMVVPLLVPRPELALGVELVLAIALVAVAIFSIVWVRVPRVPLPK
jgi:hypothetical protein